MSATSLLGSVPVRCESTPTPTVHDQLFDVRIPGNISVQASGQQDLFATAHRCMNNWCFLKPARAYVLGLYVDRPALNRLRTHSPDTTSVSREDVFRTDCPKSFVLFFASSKDSKHIKRGFGRSFENFIQSRPELDMSLINRFLTVMDGRDGLKSGDFIRVSCVPVSRTVVVSFNDDSEVRIDDAQGLIDWIHSLYVGLESNPQARYASIQSKLRLAEAL